MLNTVQLHADSRTQEPYHTHRKDHTDSSAQAQQHVRLTSIAGTPSAGAAPFAASAAAFAASTSEACWPEKPNSFTRVMSTRYM
jgi:hypothetical protein